MHTNVHMAVKMLTSSAMAAYMALGTENKHLDVDKHGSLMVQIFQYLAVNAYLYNMVVLEKD